jgi:hypothetical protein
MKFFRYRKPSLETLLGATRARRRMKKSAGIYEAMRIINAPRNARRRLKRKLG